MADILFKILQCVGFIFISLFIFGLLFGLITWALRKVFDDEQG